MIIKTPNGFVLGTRVVDTITGFKGTIIGLAEYINGIWQVLVKSPNLKDGEPLKGHWFEEPQLTELSGEINGVQSVVPKFALGQVLKCTVLPISGIVHSITYWLHGCVRYELLLDRLDREGKPVYEAFDEFYLEAKKAEPILLPKQKSGGPERNQSSVSSSRN